MQGAGALAARYELHSERLEFLPDLVVMLGRSFFASGPRNLRHLWTRKMKIDPSAISPGGAYNQEVCKYWRLWCSEFTEKDLP